MTKKNLKKHHFAFFFSLIAAACLGFCGCGQMRGYSNESLFPEDMGSVYVEMFENQSFWRGAEVSESVLSSERETGRALEKEVELQAVVNWKNLKTGELLIDNRSVSAKASFSEWQNQGFSYASALAANNLARKIVGLMEKEW